MNETQNQNLHIRMTRLERQNRFFKWALGSMLLLFFASVFMAQNPFGDRLIYANKIQLTDDKGKTRLEMSVDEQGKPMLRVIDLLDRERLRLGGSPTGPRIEILDHNGNIVWFAPDVYAGETINDTSNCNTDACSGVKP